MKDFIIIFSVFFGMYYFFTIFIVIIDKDQDWINNKKQFYFLLIPFWGLIKLLIIGYKQLIKNFKKLPNNRIEYILNNEVLQILNTSKKINFYYVKIEAIKFLREKNKKRQGLKECKEIIDKFCLDNCNIIHNDYRRYNLQWKKERGIK